MCGWNKSSCQPGELVFSIDGADVVLGKGIIQEQGGHGVGSDMSHQRCGFMHNKSFQNVQNDLECVGGYQGEINSRGDHKKGYILILSNPKKILFVHFDC